MTLSIEIDTTHYKINNGTKKTILPKVSARGFSGTPSFLWTIGTYLSNYKESDEESSNVSVNIVAGSTSEEFIAIELTGIKDGEVVFLPLSVTATYLTESKSITGKITIASGQPRTTPIRVKVVKNGRLRETKIYKDAIERRIIRNQLIHPMEKPTQGSQDAQQTTDEFTQSGKKLYKQSFFTDPSSLYAENDIDSHTDLAEGEKERVKLQIQAGIYPRPRNTGTFPIQLEDGSLDDVLVEYGLDAPVADQQPFYMPYPEPCEKQGTTTTCRDLIITDECTGGVETTQTCNTESNQTCESEWLKLYPAAHWTKEKPPSYEVRRTRRMSYYTSHPYHTIANCYITTVDGVQKTTLTEFDYMRAKYFDSTGEDMTHSLARLQRLESSKRIPGLMPSNWGSQVMGEWLQSGVARGMVELDLTQTITGLKFKDFYVKSVKYTDEDGLSTIIDPCDPTQAQVWKVISESLTIEPTGDSDQFVGSVTAFTGTKKRGGSIKIPFMIPISRGGKWAIGGINYQPFSYTWRQGTFPGGRMDVDMGEGSFNDVGGIYAPVNYPRPSIRDGGGNSGQLSFGISQNRFTKWYIPRNLGYGTVTKPIYLDGKKICKPGIPNAITLGFGDIDSFMLKLGYQKPVGSPDEIFTIQFDNEY